MREGAPSGHATGRNEAKPRIRRALVWPEPELPRTEGTRKLKRAVVRDWVKEGGTPPLVDAIRVPVQASTTLTDSA